MRHFLLTVVALFIFLSGFGQTMTELVVPKYFGSKSASSANNGRTPFAVCIRLDGLTPNQAYDVRAGIGLVSDAAGSFGAGNIWVNGSFQSSNLLNCFTTDASGSSGPFWIFFQPTGNGTRFDAGQTHNLRIGIVTNGGTMPSSPTFVGAKVMTALDIPATARTAGTSDDGAFVKGSASPTVTGKYVLLYDNVNGSGDPLFAYMVRQALPTQTSYNSELPALIKDIFSQSGTSAVGDYPAIIPIGSNNPNGVRRIEARNSDNTIYAFNTDSDGIWPSGGNTTTPARRDVVIITMGDAPLTPAATLPALTTNAVINITWNSATGGGDVSGDGGAAITARGICWATNPAPTLSDNFTSEPGTIGPFTSQMTGLNAQTTYYVRAYATNSAGTAYGNQVVFSTACLPNAPVPDFFASNLNIMVGDSISFFDNSTYCPTRWDWSFVGGMPYASSDTNPHYIHYDYPGIYNVCLTVTNAYGSQTACKMGYITVNAPPPPTNAKIVISEIMYNPPESGQDSLEFIELYNNDTAAINLHNYYFSNGIQYTFP
ncbi:MAG: lamin tail domain-containing protein, partial [Bacteroidota bacterium]|nr:lamin tail domain-containing protein [Bacteroidota bacterium]